jgi:hypothetical protein
MASNEEKQSTYQHISSGATHWLPPDEGEIKCNIDAALFEEQQRFGVGMYVRDSQ